MLDHSIGGPVYTCKIPELASLLHNCQHLALHPSDAHERARLQRSTPHITCSHDHAASNHESAMANLSMPAAELPALRAASFGCASA